VRSRLTILMSIKPRFAEKILKGEKKFELRRYIFPIPEHSRIIVYASSPIKAILGEFESGRVFKASPEAVWRFVNTFPDAGIEEEDWNYIRGARYALAIEVLNPVYYDTPIPLEIIRRYIPSFVPPMSYQIVRPGSPLAQVLKHLIKK